MIQSMTGYGAAFETFSSKAANIEIHCEIKTLNSKYLDVHIRAPKSFVGFDPDITKLVKKYLRRGRIDIYLSRQVLEGSTQELRVNFAEAEQLYKALNDVRNRLELKDAPKLRDLLQQPEWLHTSEIPVDLEEEKKFCLQVVETALSGVAKTRRSEGENLKKVLGSHRDEISQIFSSIENQNSKILDSLKVRATARLKEIFGDNSFDPQRLEQEVVFWVARADFQEEVDRFRHHLSTFDQLLDAGGEVGRRIEFLVQEMHRELNTMGSKCAAPEWTPKIIEMKALVERIREQIQNIE